MRSGAEGPAVSGSNPDMPQRTYAAIVHMEGELFAAECSEVDTVSQGRTVAEAMANLREATELYLEEFPPVNRGRPFVIVFGALA
jgi:predicted RNase H-like HicB family nuclease